MENIYTSLGFWWKIYLDLNHKVNHMGLHFSHLVTVVLTTQSVLFFYIPTALTTQSVTSSSHPPGTLLALPPLTSLLAFSVVTKPVTSSRVSPSCKTGTSTPSPPLPPP